MIRVMIVSPNSALRIGLRELLGRQPDIQIAGEAVDLEGIHEMETEVLVLASVSSARLLEIRSCNKKDSVISGFNSGVIFEGRKLGLQANLI